MRKQVSVKFGLFTIVFAFVKSRYFSANDGFKTAVKSFDQVKSHFFYFREIIFCMKKIAARGFHFFNAWNTVKVGVFGNSLLQFNNFFSYRIKWLIDFQHSKNKAVRCTFIANN